MKKLCTLFITLACVLGLAFSPVFAAGGKVRGNNGDGTVAQDFCGPYDDCEGDPYWW